MTYQTTKTTVIMVSMIVQMNKTKYKTSRSSVVIFVFGSLVRVLMRPKTVLSPVATTIPVPEPMIQWVPWRPILYVSK